jgi:uncharacterized membrane protein YkoI
MKKFCLLIILLAAQMPISGLANDDHDKARRLKEAGDILPLQEVIKKAQAEHPGRVIEVELDEDDDRHVYEIELLDERGEVWEFKIDAATGELIKRERED